MATFVIREKYFGYNDEVFYETGSRIHNVFTDQVQAEVVYKQLEIAAARNFPLYEVESLFEASEEELNALDVFVFSRCGEHIIEEGYLVEDVLPETLNDEDTFEFLQRANISNYQLLVFDQDAKFYGLWSLKEQDWFKQYDEDFTGLIYATSADQLKAHAGHIFEDYDDADIELQGSIEDLSHHPVLFQSMIGTSEGLFYDENTHTLTIRAWDSDALFAIHPLLKQPLFEIRELSVPEIQRIEEELREEDGFMDEDDDELFDEDTFEAEVEAIIRELAQEFAEDPDPKTK